MGWDGMRIRQGNKGNSLPLEAIAVTDTGWQVAFVVFQEERDKDPLGTTL